jgi:hypothetical protein
MDSNHLVPAESAGRPVCRFSFAPTFPERKLADAIGPARSAGSGRWVARIPEHAGHRRAQSEVGGRQPGNSARRCCSPRRPKNQSQPCTCDRLESQNLPLRASITLKHAFGLYRSRWPSAMRRSTCIPSVAVEPGFSSIYNAKVSDAAAMPDAFVWWENRTDSRGAWNWRALPLSLGAVPPQCPAGEHAR